MSGCDCIDQMNARLAEHNTRLTITFGFPRDGSPPYSRPTLETEKIETRKRGRTVVALPSFCPFCGRRYGTEPAVPKTPGGQRAPTPEDPTSDAPAAVPAGVSEPAAQSELVARGTNHTGTGDARHD